MHQNPQKKEPKEFKVRNTSVPKSLAAAICLHTSRKEPVYLSCIGAGAVNQAMKAATIARQRLQNNLPKIDLVVVPVFHQNPAAPNDSEVEAVMKTIATTNAAPTNVDHGKTVMRFYMRVV